MTAHDWQEDWPMPHSSSLTTSVPTRLGGGRASATAEINAQMRAADAALVPARRLVGDPFAKHFAASPRYRLLRLTPGVALAGLRLFDRLYGGLLAEILLRGRYLEDGLVAAAGQGVTQVVLLGAGYDATALRGPENHPELRGVRFFEVDHPATQQVKRSVLRQIGADTGRITFVPADLAQGVPLDGLVDAGFDVARPCLVAWLGVSYYLSFAAFERILADIAALCAPDSTLIYDYLVPQVVDGTTGYRGARRAARSVRRRGEPYTLGLTDQQAVAAAQAAGFALVDSSRVPELVRRYGGRTPYCRPDDYLGVLTLTRTGPRAGR
jgi:methyltransferase (TIGR00027 family)